MEGTVTFLVYTEAALKMPAQQSLFLSTRTHRRALDIKHVLVNFFPLEVAGVSLFTQNCLFTLH